MDRRKGIRTWKDRKEGSKYIKDRRKQMFKKGGKMRLRKVKLRAREGGIKQEKDRGKSAGGEDKLEEKDEKGLSK